MSVILCVNENEVKFGIYNLNIGLLTQELHDTPKLHI